MIPTAPTTGSKFKLGYQPIGSASGVAYTYLLNLKKVTPPKGANDGADTTVLLSKLKSDTPTIPKIDAALTVLIVESDSTYTDLQAAFYNGTLLSFQFLHPSGATKTWDGWINSMEPSELSTDEVRMTDFGISIITLPVYTAAPSS